MHVLHGGDEVLLNDGLMELVVDDLSEANRM